MHAGRSGELLGAFWTVRQAISKLEFRGGVDDLRDPGPGYHLDQLCVGRKFGMSLLCCRHFHTPVVGWILLWGYYAVVCSTSLGRTACRARNRILPSQQFTSSESSNPFAPAREKCVRYLIPFRFRLAALRKVGGGESERSHVFDIDDHQFVALFLADEVKEA